MSQIPHKKHLMFVTNVDWFFISHRLPIALAAQKNGYKITVVAKETGQSQQLIKQGINFINLPLSRSGTNPFVELKTLFKLLYIYFNHKPDIVHHIALKAVIYGSLSARILKLPIVNAISGLGYNFIKKTKQSPINTILKTFLRFSLNNKQQISIFQNPDDIALFRENGLLIDGHIKIIEGSGVDLKEFQYKEQPVGWPIVITLPARILWDKGVGEFVSAARVLKKEFKDKVEFWLAGNTDYDNPSFIPKTQIIEWENEGIIKWLGYQTNMPEILALSSIVVLPSYREGLPKSLIEALAIGRPVVTTDAPGCRQVITHGENGFLVPVKNTDILIKAIRILILDKNLRKKMGILGRIKAEKKFSLDKVVNSTLEIYNIILNKKL